MRGAERGAPAAPSQVPGPEVVPAATEGVDDVWAPLRRLTPSRIGIGRAGDALPTTAQLELRLAHARARDAVHAPLDPDRLRADLEGREFAEVRSAAPDRETYLQRPDLGRRLAEGEAERLQGGPCEVVIVLADGLSPRAIHDHAPGVLRALAEALPAARDAPLVVAHQARVALGDEIGAALGAELMVLLVGERPGLSAADSLGIYLTYGPRPGRSDAERNCVSNVRPPHGQSYAAATGIVAALAGAALERGLTGVALKDESVGVPVLGAGD